MVTVPQTQFSTAKCLAETAGSCRISQFGKKKKMLTHVCLLSGLHHVQGLHQRFDSKNETGHQIGQVNLGHKFTSGKNWSTFFRPFIVQDLAIPHWETGPFEIQTICLDFKCFF